MERVQQSDLSSQIKENAGLSLYYTTGYVAARTGDLAGALAKARHYLKGTQALENPNLIRLAHQLAAVIALEARDYDKSDHACQLVRQAYQVGIASASVPLRYCLAFAQRPARSPFLAGHVPGV